MFLRPTVKTTKEAPATVWLKKNKTQAPVDRADGGIPWAQSSPGRILFLPVSISKVSMMASLSGVTNNRVRRDSADCWSYVSQWWAGRLQ